MGSSLGAYGENYRINSTRDEGYKTTVPSNNDNNDEKFKRNVSELKKVRQDMEDKSLKLMAIREWETSSEMLMKAVDVLFDCGMVMKRSFLQT